MVRPSAIDDVIARSTDAKGKFIKDQDEVLVHMEMSPFDIYTE
jgi:hypothetical protein